MLQCIRNKKQPVGLFNMCHNKKVKWKVVYSNQPFTGFAEIVTYIKKNSLQDFILTFYLFYLSQLNLSLVFVQSSYTTELLS